MLLNLTQYAPVSPWARQLIDTNVLPAAREAIMFAADLVPFPDCLVVRVTYRDRIKLQPNFAETVLLLNLKRNRSRYYAY